ncbi:MULTISPECIES: hypothetical protein [unclassified Coleofasciculus]|uniref:hypothetical protein n=1 Tax=unclassified Coleofasciculus TaxID=2692782 RepID=UPI00188040EC|nr:MULTISPECIES: hypothetical protein [unclassified Coleofasciculus]MBE9127509.1 hypothetical protein [Coleofasciculus sp. LEGE 07081]MBE9150829.1 hypothetical protein [Coleofasciculus sp. LEGE 07092]
MKSAFRRLSLASTFLLTFALVTYGTIPAAKAQNKYPPQVVTNYMRGCQQSAVNGGLSEAQAERVCACTINRFQARFTIEQFRELLQRARETGGQPQELVEIGQACAQEVFR